MKKTRSIALCGVMAALSTVLLYLGCIIDILDMSAAVIAGILLMALVVEAGEKNGWMTFGCVSLLSLFILPSKFPGLMYVTMFGWYTVAKPHINRLSRPMHWLVTILTGTLSALIWIGASFLFLPASEELTLWWSVLLVLLYNFVMVCYDFLLNVCLMLYITKIRPRLHLK